MPRTRLVRASAWGQLSCGSAGKCATYSWQTCDDGKNCTYDGCSGAAGGQCSSVAYVGILCSDGDACTSKDTCNSVQACIGTTVVCNDNNACTADTCDKLKGCSNEALPDTTPCGGGKTCKAGACL